MPEPTNEATVEILLRRIEADVTDLKVDVREVRGRKGRFEIRLAHMEPTIAERSVRRDRRDEQMERILRRLELSDHPR
jgi:hypothetical protein